MKKERLESKNSFPTSKQGRKFVYYEQFAVVQEKNGDGEHYRIPLVLAQHLQLSNYFKI